MKKRTVSIILFFFYIKINFGGVYYSVSIGFQFAYFQTSDKNKLFLIFVLNFS